MEVEYQQEICFLFVRQQMREEALQRELQALRLALLKKRACSTCTNGQITNHCTTPGIVDETVSEFLLELRNTLTFHADKHRLFDLA